MISNEQLDHLLDELPRYDATDDVVARVLDRVAADQAEQAPGSRLRRLPSWTLAVAALLLVGIGFALRPPAPAPVDGLGFDGTNGPLIVKGGGDVPGKVELGLSLLRDGVPVAIPSGAEVRAADTVLFRYTTDTDGFVYLFRASGGKVEVFSGVAALPGTHHLEVGGEIQGYTLRDVGGDQTFGAAWSVDAWTAGESGPVAPRGLLTGEAVGVAIDSRTLHVVP